MRPTSARQDQFQFPAATRLDGRGRSWENATGPRLTKWSPMMSVQANGQTRLELRDGGGNLVQVFVPQQELDRLRADLDDARKQIEHWRGSAEELKRQLGKTQQELAAVR